MFFLMEEEFRNFIKEPLEFDKEYEISRYLVKPNRAYVEAMNHGYWVKVRENKRYQYIYVTRKSKMTNEEVFTQINALPSYTNMHMRIKSNPTGSRLDLFKFLSHKSGMWVSKNAQWIDIILNPVNPELFFRMSACRIDSTQDLVIHKSEDRRLIESLSGYVKTRRLTANVLHVTKIKEIPVLVV